MLGALLLTSPLRALEQEPVEVAVLGRFARGPVGVPVRVDAAGFSLAFGSSAMAAWPAEIQASRFFAQGGTHLHVIRATPSGGLLQSLAGSPQDRSGLHALPLVRDLGILICPELTLLPEAEIPAALQTWKAALASSRATMILDPPPGWTTAAQATTWAQANIPPGSPHFALYFPYLEVSSTGLDAIGSSGTLAAAWLQNDAASGRGIWSSPAGTGLVLKADSLSKILGEAEQTALNNAGVGILRSLPEVGIVPWSARHLDGGVTGNPENRFIPIQRTLDWIGVNLVRRGNAVATHRANDPALWALLRSEADSVLGQMHARGAFPGATAAQNFFVQCGLGTTMTQADVDAGRVILRIGVALLRPSEFLIQSHQWNTRDAARPPADPVLLLLPAADPSARQIVYFATPGASHTLRFSNTLTGAWGTLTNPATGDGTWISRALPLDGPQQFFRLEQTPLPPP